MGPGIKTEDSLVPVMLIPVLVTLETEHELALAVISSFGLKSGDEKLVPFCPLTTTPFFSHSKVEKNPVVAAVKLTRLFAHASAFGVDMDKVSAGKLLVW